MKLCTNREAPRESEDSVLLTPRQMLEVNGDHRNCPQAVLFVCDEGLGVINHDLLVGLSPFGRKWIRWLLSFIRTLDLGIKKKKKKKKRRGGQELL